MLKVLDFKVGRGKIEHKGMEVEVVNPISSDDLTELLNLISIGEYSDWDECNRYKFDDSLEEIGSGTYGTVYGYKTYAIKYFDRVTEKNRDIEVLTDLSHLDCIPTLYATIGDRVMIMERVFGKTVRQYCNRGEDNNNCMNVDEKFIDKWQQALFDVIQAGYSPDDLHESNVMIDARTCTPKLVDVGWFFKHQNTYDSNEEMCSDYGYDNADQWTGVALRNYVRKQKLKAEQEEKEDEVVVMANGVQSIGRIMERARKSSFISFATPSYTSYDSETW